MAYGHVSSVVGQGASLVVTLACTVLDFCQLNTDASFEVVESWQFAASSEIRRMTVVRGLINFLRSLSYLDSYSITYASLESDSSFYASFLGYCDLESSLDVLMCCFYLY